MEELVIKSHSFEEAKKQLKEFSEQTTTDLDLKKVDADKGFGEFMGDFLFGRGLGLDHKVTGSELNQLTVQIQDHLKSINDMHRKFINEIGCVYTALESLDKDYIQSILIAIKSAQKANGEAKIAQNNIEKTVEEQKKIIKVLQKFKEKLDNVAHIEDIDGMWSELQIFQDSISDNNKSIAELENFKNRVDNYKHLSKIDKMWEDNQSNQKSIAHIKESTEQLITALSKQMEDLSSKLESQENILSSNEKILKKLNSLKHIYEVDNTYQVVDDTAKKVDNISKKIQEYLSSVEESNKAVHEMNNRMEKIDSMLDEYVELKKNIKKLNESKVNLEKENTDLHNKLEEMENRFSNKIKMAYLLAGGSIGLVVIEFILVMLGLI